MSELEIDFLESLIPQLIISSLNLAYFKTIESGSSVLEAMEDGNIYEIFPDGHREFIKKSSPYIPSEIGKKIILQ